MNEAEKSAMLERAVDAMIDKPVTFKVGGKYFYLNHASLGKMRLLERLYSKLDFNSKSLEHNANLEYMRVCSRHRDTVLRIITYHTIRDKGGIMNEAYVRTRMEFFGEHLDNADIASVLMAAHAMDDINGFMSVLGIAKDNEKRDVVAQVKSESHSVVSFGSVSDYGRLLYRGCELLHDYDYVVWGISYVNLILLLNDAPTVITVTDEERKRLPKSVFRHPKSSVIDASDPGSWSKIKDMR